MTAGGVALPVILHRLRRRGGSARRFWYWAVPTVAILPAAALAAFWTLPEKFLRGSGPLHPHVNMAFVSRSGEFKEYCLAMAMMFYALSVFLRMPRASSGARQGDPPLSPAAK